MIVVDLDADIGVGRPRVAGDVRDGLADDGDDILDHLGGHDEIHRAVEGEPWWRGQTRPRLADSVENSMAQGGASRRGRREGEDDGADLRDGGIDRVHLLEDHPARSLARAGRFGLQGQSGAEQSLDDVVVQIAGDARAVLDALQLLPVQARLHELQRNACLAGEFGRSVDVDVRDPVLSGALETARAPSTVPLALSGTTSVGPTSGCDSN
nr:hypothetical protein [Pseudolysinimonas kribbensis]